MKTTKNKNKEVKMKCLLNVKKGKIKICEIEKPTCKDNTMLVKKIYSGLSNGTERNVLTCGNYWSGSFPDYLNYQAVAEVVEIGKEIKNYNVGDIIFAATFAGHMHYHLVTEDDLIIKLPEGFDLQEAALLGVASVAFHAAVRASVTASDNVLVMGAGLIGLFTVQAVLAHGATVSIADLNDMRLDFAKKIGADNVFNTSTQEGKTALEAKGPYTIVFEMTGAQQVLDFVIGTGFNLRPPNVSTSEVLKHMSRVVITAARKDVQYNFNEAEDRELTIIHNTHFNVADLKNVVRLVRKGIIRIKPLITKVVKFSDSVDVFETLVKEPMSLLGTVIDWRDIEDL